MRFTVLALVVPAVLGASIPVSAENVGEATRIQRFAYQTPPQATKGPIYKLDPVVRNARLETVPSGALEVKFTDGSRLTLGSASSVVVDDFVYAGGGGAGSQTLKMTRGAFRFVSGSMPKDKVKLKTDNVSIGIRGTIVKLLVKDDKSGTIFFVHGSGNVENDKGQNVPMGEGDMVKFGPDGTIGTPENKSWTVGESAVDDGMEPFGPRGGPDAGTGGGDGAGSSGGGGNDNR